jgi:hypothetical protein
VGSRANEGLYSPATGQRLPVLDENGAPVGDVVKLNLGG